MGTWDSDGGGEADFKKARRVKAKLQDDHVDRSPPSSTEAEQGVLGCCLLSPNDCIPICVTKFNGRSDVFYDLRHRAIYECLVEMWDNKEAIDTITVMTSLRDLMQLESVGGLLYLSSLPDTVPSAANIDYYVEILREKFTLRTAITTFTEGVDKLYEHQGDVDSLIEQVENDVLGIANIFGAAEVVIHAKPLATAAMAKFSEIAQLDGVAEGLTTGFMDIDKLTGGFKPGEMVVIAARPSCGKTSLAMNIADHVAVECNIPVGVFSLETTSLKLMMRAHCSRARVSMRDIRNGVITPQDTDRLMAAYNSISNSPLYIDDTGGLTIIQLRAKARRMHQLYGIKLFVIDYLQLLFGSGKRSSNRQEEVSELSRGVKALGKELGVPILVLAQLNRDLEKDKPRKPRMSDIRESGSIEADADIIGLLYKPAMPEGAVEDPAFCLTNLIIGKNKDGEQGEIPLMFQKTFTRFESAAFEPPPPSTQNLLAFPQPTTPHPND
jgi:replicative DNA helicase